MANVVPSEIREGFLCPECQSQFPTHMQLESHYEIAHLLDQNESKANISTPANSLKDILGKAKKILTNDERSDSSSTPSGSGGVEETNQDDQIQRDQISKTEESVYYLQLREGQTIGLQRDLFNDHFKRIRDSRIERQVIETNKLLIILDKLLRGMPQDPDKRKIHEMNIVKWANNDDVALCPSCAKSFNIKRRRHHCRLCGAIMCHDCSQFLELTYARKLIAPVNLENPEQPVQHIPPSGIVTNEANGSSSPGGKLMAKLSDKTSSLLNLSMGKESNSPAEIQIRTCSDCKRLLDKRNRQIENRHAHPQVKVLYEKLKELQAEADKLVPTYLKMCNSLRSGETTYKLNDAKTVRIQLMKLTDAIAIVSRKIYQLDVVEDEPPPVTMPIQNKLRLFASQYIRDVMCGLPNLPREEELEQLQEQRHRQLQIEIELEKKRLKNQAQNHELHKSAQKPKSSLPAMGSENVSISDGWGIQNVTVDDDIKEMDPILVQISILNDYIKQARQDHRYDEVNMLENNLKQLEIEYYLQDDSISPAKPSEET